MKCLNRNKQKFWYALYAGQEEIIDEYGNSTGQYKKSYSHPVECRANISASKGDVSSQMFGDALDYTKTIAIESSPIDEFSVLWVDREPSLEEDGSLKLNENGDPITPHDYVVKQVASSLNSVLIAIQKVDVQ